eukprot:Em0009g285a
MQGHVLWFADGEPWQVMRQLLLKDLKPQSHKSLQGSTTMEAHSQPSSKNLGHQVLCFLISDPNSCKDQWMKHCHEIQHQELMARLNISLVTRAANTECRYYLERKWEKTLPDHVPPDLLHR